MRKILLPLVVAMNLTVASVAGAQAPAQAPWLSSPAKELVEKARAATVQVPLTEFKAAFDTKGDFVIVDVRNPDEYSAVHVPGAINIPRGVLEFVIWPVVPDKTKKIYVYCRTSNRAALATKALNDLGYKNAVMVQEGMKGWAKAGYPVKTSITDDEVILAPAK